jgi:predicted PolB exonuclease-like 3'-5' exonuclease
MNTLVFDIETVPDVEFGRRLHGLDGLDDEEVGKAMQARARQESGSDFLPHEQQRIVASGASGTSPRPSASSCCVSTTGSKNSRRTS